MNCSIENIKDENLTKHIEVFGPEQGLITYLDKVAKGESTEVKNPSLIKDGVQELFESNPELANIGTPEQYSQYLDTIFPDSKVKDIVYHGTKEKFNLEDFGKQNIGKNTGTLREKGYYFAKIENINAYITDITTEYDNETGESFPVGIKTGTVISAILNNPEVIKEKDSDQFGYGYINEYDSYFTKTLKQIYILGNKQDIEGFKEFTGNNEQEPLHSFEPEFPFTKESADKINEGEKTITLRTKNLKSGVYKVGGKTYQINNQGFYKFKDYLDISGADANDVIQSFVQEDDIKYEHVQDWFQNKGAMYVYHINEVFPSHDALEQDTSPKATALSKLKSALNKTQENLKKETDEASREILEARIKKLKSKIDYFETEEVITIKNLLDIANEQIEQALELAREGNPLLANYYIDVFKGLFPTDGVNDEILANIALVNEKIGKAEELITETMKTNLVASVKNRNEYVDGNGKMKAYVQDKSSTTQVLSAATSNNSWVRMAVTKIHNAMNAIQVNQNFMRSSINKLTKALGKARDPKALYDFMLQKNDKGELTGYTVEKKNFAYVDALKKVRLNFKEGSIGKTAITKYLNFLRDNHDIVFNQEMYDAYLASRRKAIEKRIIADDPSVRQEAIDKAYAAVLYNSDPARFKSIVTKAKRTDEEVKYASQFLRFYKSYMTYDITNPNFIDEKYTAIEQMDDSDPRKQFYAYYTSQLKKARLLSPDENRFLGDNFIPELSEEINWFKKVSNAAYYYWSEKPEDGREFYKDPVTGESSMSIPGSYMLDSRLVASDKSYDLSKVLEKFLSATINKTEKAKIEDEAKMIMHLVKSQPEYVTVEGKIVYENGRPLERPPVENNAYESLKYFVESQLYDKRQARDGTASQVRYDPVLTEKYEKAKEQLANKEITKEDFDKIEAEWKASGRSVTTKKVVNSLINFSSLKALSLNFFSGVAEIAQATSALYIEAAGGKFFNDSNLNKAYGKAMKMMKSEKEAEKWFNNFPIINDFGYDTPQGKIVDKLFFVFKQSEKLAKGALLFARLDNIKVKDVDGNEVSLLDALEFDEKGQIKLDPTRFNVDFSTGSEFRNQVTNELHALSRTLLARDSNRDPIPLSKHALGRLLGHFKASWLFEGITRRFASEYKSELGDTEGYYRTVFFDEKGLNIKRALNIIMTAQFHPEKLKEFGIKDLSVANVKRALREFKIAGSLMLFYLAAAALAGFDDDDDEMDDVMGKGIMNLAWRFNRDLTYFINPNSTVDLLGSSPMASISTIKQGLTLMYAIGETATYPLGIGEMYLNKGQEGEKLKIWDKMEPLIPGWQGIKSTYTRATE